MVVDFKEVALISNNNKVVKENQSYLDSDGTNIICESPIYGWVYFRKRETELINDGVHPLYIKQSYIIGNPKATIFKSRVLPKITNDELIILLDYNLLHLTQVDYKKLVSFINDNNNTLAQKIKAIQGNSLSDEKIIIQTGLYNGNN